jgi:hypothetical protein
MIEILAQITSTKPKFCAGIVLFDDVVVEAAPIVKYMKKWSRDQVREYCKKRGWEISIVHEMKRTGIAKR